MQRLLAVLAAVGVLLLAVAAARAASAPRPARRARAALAAAVREVRQLRPEVLAVYSHDTQAFTQGLVWHDGVLYESAGLYGESSLRRVEIETGQVQAELEVAPELFAEGLALVGEQLIQLTWREKTAFVYQRSDFAVVQEHAYLGEGWGLCFDGQRLVMSDGTDQLYFRDPQSFALRHRVAVTLRGRRLTRLNELECVGNSVYANVWLTDVAVEIDKRSGRVRAEIDMSQLLTAEERAALGPGGVLNGIAYDPTTETFLVTGKLWPKLFRVQFVPQ